MNNVTLEPKPKSHHAAGKTLSAKMGKEVLVAMLCPHPRERGRNRPRRTLSNDKLIVFLVSEVISLFQIACDSSFLRT